MLNLDREPRTLNREPRTCNLEGVLMADTVWIFGKDT
jgi:hypothetical protein